MKSLNFRTLDLNLLRVFDEVMTERNLTRAASNLSMTQPAVSNALRRLRELLGDDLVRRAGYGVEPTPLAVHLWPTVREALNQLQEAFSPGVFVPQTAQQHFVLAMADATAAKIMPALVYWVGVEAPLVTLRVLPLTTRDPRDMLEAGEVDLAIGHFPGVLAELNASHLQDHLKCTLGPMRETVHDGLAAFTCALPKRLHRLQRREYHRVSIPVGLAVKCEIPQSIKPADTLHAPRQAVHLIDISLGGVAFEETPGSSLTLSMGMVLPNCRLQLDDMGVVNVDMEIRYLSDIHTRSGQVRRKVGCMFKRLSAGGENLIQRFINRLDLDRKTPTPDA